MDKYSSILLVSEGTYPYNYGGVSTWAHQICSRISEKDFYIYSINADIELAPRFPLGENIKDIVQVPMWSVEEPLECINHNTDYTKVFVKKEETTEALVAEKFVPAFKSFILEFYKDHPNLGTLDQSLHTMWQYFTTHDYKATMTSKAVWRSFNACLLEVLSKEEFTNLKMVDVTIGMRWLYRFLIPISIPAPSVDIVHITIAGVAMLPALALKYQNNTPILLTEHGVFIRERLLSISSSDYSHFLKRLLIKFSEAITRLTYHHADQITTVSRFNIKWAQHYGAQDKKLKVIYNGVDQNLFYPRERLITDENRPTVVAAARIFDLKDIETMIRTCYEVRKKIPDVLFKVYGNKDAVPVYTESCNKLIKELDLVSNFELAGFHSSPELIYAEGDISILTSISEGFPYTVLESMSSGIPVVATDVGGVSEALDESCGFLCKPRDYRELASKVVLLLNNKDLREIMGANARQRVLSHFTQAHFVREFRTTYEKLMVREKRDTRILN